MNNNLSIFGIVTSIVVTTFFVAYIIGVSVVSNDDDVKFNDFLVSCNRSPCDYTAIGALVLGTLLSIIVASVVYYKQREINRKLDNYGESHIQIANGEIPPYLEAIHEIAETWVDDPLPTNNFQDDHRYQGMMRQMKIIRDITLISGSFIDADLSHDLIFLNIWVQHDFPKLISSGDSLAYVRLRDDCLNILNTRFPNYVREP